MNHTILTLNSKRSYVLVDHPVYDYFNPKGTDELETGEWKVLPVGRDQTWYDTNVSFETKVGDSFLNGTVTEVLTYEEYTKKYDNKVEMFAEVNEQTEHKGFIRKVSEDKLRGNRPFDFWFVPKVKFGVNPTKSGLATLMEKDLAN